MTDTEDVSVLPGSSPVGSVDLDAIEARADAATPGPWATERWSQGLTVEGPAPRYELLLACEDGAVPTFEREADAEFTAHARSDVPALIAEVRRLSSELAAARGEADDLRLKLNAALCNVTWPSGQHTVPHVCVEPDHHLTRHRCTCGVKG